MMFNTYLLLHAALKYIKTRRFVLNTVFFFCLMLIIVYTFVFANLKRVLSEQIEKCK